MCFGRAISWDTGTLFQKGIFVHMHVNMHTHAHTYIVTDLINALPGNSSVNKVQHATIEEAVLHVRGDVTKRWVVVM
jgi:hypothetical protein